MSVATSALPCDGHVETQSDAGCEWLALGVVGSLCDPGWE